MATDKERLAILNKSNPMDALSIHPYQIAHYCMKCGLSSFYNQKHCVRCGHRLEIRCERTSIPCTEPAIASVWDTIDTFNQ